MAETLRTCAKTGCRWPAASSLSYRYSTRQVWLLDLSPALDPSLYDLCPHHADVLSVPRGWERVDDRSEPLVVVEPSARDRADLDAGWGREEAADVVSGRRPPNRYAALVEQLPRLAAEVAAQAGPPAPSGSRTGDGAQQPAGDGPPDDEPAPRPGPGSSHPSGGAAAAAAAQVEAGAVPLHGEPPEPVPSRELAPPLASRPWAPPTPAPPVPGQLVIPVDEGDGTLADDAVVVSIDAAGSRRRPTRD